jgi:hypothetical protein
MDRPEREEKEIRHWQMFGVELRVDEWRDKYHCKKVPHSSFVKVIKVIGVPEDPTGLDFLPSFFAELQNQRPDLFIRGAKPAKKSETLPSPSPIIAHPPPLPLATPPPLPDAPPERVIQLNCSNCQQNIEVNADAEGQSFDCPNCGSKVDVGNFEDYQTPAINSETAPPSFQTVTQPRQDNLITIGSIAAVLVIGTLLFSLTIKTKHRDTAKKAAEAEHQRKVDAVAKRIADAQAKRDAAPKTEKASEVSEQEPELTAEQKHEARVAAIKFTLMMKKRN